MPISRRSFNIAAVAGLVSVPALGFELQDPATSPSELVVSGPAIAPGNPVDSALDALAPERDGVKVTIQPNATSWDVVLVPSQDPLPADVVDLLSTGVPGTAARTPDSPVGRVQSEVSTARVTVAAAMPAVFVRKDALDSGGFRGLESLEDFTALVLGVALGTRHSYGFTGSAGTATWTEVVTSFVSNLAAYNQEGLLRSQLGHGYDFLQELVRSAGPPENTGLSRADALHAFLSGDCAVLLDDALFAAEVTQGAEEAGFEVAQFAAPAGPSGRAQLAQPGLDILVSSTSEHPQAAAAVAGDLLGAASRATPRAPQKSPLPTLSSAAAADLLTPLGLAPGSERDDAIGRAASVLGR